MKQFLFILLSLLFASSTSLYAARTHLYQDNVQHILAKTAIHIEYPTSGTVWEAPSTIELKWSTENIPTNKTIKFYLSKDDMVVQELGIFKNNGYINEIKLEGNLQEGDNYRVIGIELFPDNKKSIAKFATPFFTIKKLPRPKKNTSETVAEKPKIVEEQALRDTFDGRKLTYVNEISVDSDKINIYIWDHGRKDGDIVSIYLNGEAVVSKYSLEYYKRKVELTLDPLKPNDLFLYAHNLGKFPPNTVSIEITDGKSSENIILNSDLKSCEAVLINVKD